MKIKKGRLHTLDGEYAEALELFREVRAAVDVTPEQYFEASKGSSQVLAQMKRWSEAAEYPEFLIVTQSRIARERWPEMKDFLEKCYSSGAQRPAAQK